MGEKTMNPQVQNEHPHQSPDAEANAENAPKVDAGNSGATVGTPGSAADVVAGHRDYVTGVLDDQGKGYLGHNPDPNSNDDYTVAGVTAGAGEEVVPEDDADADKTAQA